MLNQTLRPGIVSYVDGSSVSPGTTGVIVSPGTIGVTVSPGFTGVIVSAGTTGVTVSDVIVSGVGSGVGVGSGSFWQDTTQNKAINNAKNTEGRFFFIANRFSL